MIDLDHDYRSGYFTLMRVFCFPKSVIFALLGVLLLVSGAPALAYVVPGPQLLDLMTARLGMADTLSVTQRLALLDSQGATSGVALRETLRYRFPAMFRLESQSESTRRIILVVDSEAIVIVGNQRISGPEEVWDRYKDILFYRAPDVLQAQLGVAGVDVSVSSMGRFEGRPCFVLGAQYPSVVAPQIWIEKDTFLPIRWLIPPSSSGRPTKQVEFRYLDWQSQSKLWYPMRIQVIEADKPVREISVEQVEVNPALDGSLFDIGLMKQKFPVAVTVHPGREPLQPSEDIKKTIDNFKKRYE